MEEHKLGVAEKLVVFVTWLFGVILFTYELPLSRSAMAGLAVLLVLGMFAYLFK